MRRKDFLIGMGGLAVGAPSARSVPGGRRWRDRNARSSRTPEPTPPPPQGHMSYAQAGEDVIVNFFFAHLKVTDISYLDIGAYDPVLINNTYFFYRQGHRGVLVEPNVAMCEKLRAVRPEDATLEAGIGIDKPGEADYYVMSEPSWNTFDKAEAEHQVKVTGGKVTIKEVRRMPLLSVNDVMAEHFKERHRPSCPSTPKAGTSRYSSRSTSRASGPRPSVSRRWSPASTAPCLRSPSS